MVAIFAILIFIVYLIFFFPMEPRVKKEEEKSPKYTAQMKKLWQIAQTSMKERKPFRAEKALLTILKVFGIRSKESNYDFSAEMAGRSDP
jgi:hypothetical protein